MIALRLGLQELIGLTASRLCNNLGRSSFFYTGLKAASNTAQRFLKVCADGIFLEYLNAIEEIGRCWTKHAHIRWSQ